MTLTIIFPALVMLLGLLIWLLAGGRLGEIGKIAFVVGLFWSVYALMGHTLKL